AAVSHALAESRGSDLVLAEVNKLCVDSRFKEALTLVEAQLSRDPHSAELLFTRQNILWQTAPTIDVIWALNQFSDANPDHVGAHYALARIYVCNTQPLSLHNYRNPQERAVVSMVSKLPTKSRQEQVIHHLNEIQRLRPDSAMLLVLRAAAEPDDHRAIVLLDK